MQFITVLALLLTAVAAVPSGTEASMMEARDIGISVAHRTVGDTMHSSSSVPSLVALLFWLWPRPSASRSA
ncbi:hypothetical protein BKA61DRAFT_601202 [Leptodontidium sp. MPI-SDFR-AT-0119]|nr:hypothetical protein BKA61DRAFT_601202 [Leptodontidium sp. MPI-SDFR-AT-0119]